MLAADNTNEEVQTPLRMGNRANANADNLSLPPTSPGGLTLPPTSPARGLGPNISEIDLSSPLNYGTPRYFVHEYSVCCFKLIYVL